MVDFLQSRNQKGYLSFIDINTSDFYLDLKYGITYKQAMERIHSLKSDGSVIKNIKFFLRVLYFDWFRVDLYTNKITYLDKCIELIYGLWAKYIENNFSPFYRKAMF